MILSNSIYNHDMTVSEFSSVRAPNYLNFARVEEAPAGTTADFPISSELPDEQIFGGMCRCGLCCYRLSYSSIACSTLSDVIRSSLRQHLTIGSPLDTSPQRQLSPSHCNRRSFAHVLDPVLPLKIC